MVTFANYFNFEHFMKQPPAIKTPTGIQALILSKYYYGVLSKNLELLGIERYYSILYFLHENNGCCQQHICNHLAIDKTAMVKVIRYLSRAGLIERMVNPEDRREHFISLTKKGQRDAQIVVKAFALLDKKIFGSVSNQHRVIYERVTGALIDNLRSMPGNDLFFHYTKTQGKITSPRKKSTLKTGSTA
jgi:MarR family transcriptional regulator, transcriptional regulator for hemolysin